MLSSQEPFFWFVINAAKCFRNTCFSVSYQRRKGLQNFFLSVMLKSAELIFMVSYQRRKVLQNSIFWFLINAAKCFRNTCFSVSYQRRKGLQNFFLSVMLKSAELIFMVSYQRRKLLQNSIFWFPINAAKCCRISFFGLI